MTTSVHPFGTLGKEVRQSIENDYDVKIIVTSHNSKPGLGKTTLAILMAKAWDPNGWRAQEDAFMDGWEFHNAYMEKPPGSVILFDEVENEMDARRSNASKNVELTQMLATQRFRNIVSIYTLPTVSMLDNRMMEMADYWINVMKRGVAHPYRVLVNDFNGSVYRKRIGQTDHNDGETITWRDPREGTEAYADKRYLDDLKREQNKIDREYLPESEVRERIEKEVASAKREKRDEIIQGLISHEELDIPTTKLAEVEGVELSQPRVHQIANSS